jgi:PAS domain S-box-containing protein
VELNATLEQRVEERTHDLDEANQKISKARDLFYALFNTNPIPTALTHLEDDIFIHVNNEFLKYFDFQRDKIIGHRAEEFGLGLGLGLGLEHERQSREKLIEYVRKEGRIGNYELEIQHPSGEMRNVLASVQHIFLDESDALITTFIDITDRVRAEQKIRALAAELTGTEQTERHRLSQILHDDLQQRLFAIQMHLSFIRDAYEKNDLNAFGADFPQLEEWLAESIRVTRRLSVDLSPPIVHGEGLVEAVIWLAAQMNEQYGLKIDIKANSMPTEVEEKVRVLVFYAIRELLFNIVKHAGILEVAVRFEDYNSYLMIIVKDHGAGFDSSRVMNDPQMAHGLLVIRERLNLLGCKMNITSQPGKGTEAIIEVPYEKMDTNL